MGRMGRKYKFINDDDVKVQGLIKLAAEGKMTCAKGAELSGVNRESFRVAVRAEQQRQKEEKEQFEKEFNIGG